MPTRQGSIHLFRFAGIDVFLHWSWFLVAAYEISNRKGNYSSVTWNVLEYLALFVIVMCHEYGHALACRQVGGRADQIVLWPLGGVAYVDPPPRPGATLWSIAAGPLVNVVLVPVLMGVGMLARAGGWARTMPDVYHLLRSIFFINVGLLVFNLLPVYPLDGGQILRSLLWFPLGRARSQMAAVVIGFLGAAGLIVFSFWTQSAWLGILSVFVGMNCWAGFRHAQALSRLARLPRHLGYACPCCQTAPPVGNFWKCPQCSNAFDTFQTYATCPHCALKFDVTGCLDCGRKYPFSEWVSAAHAAPGL